MKIYHFTLIFSIFALSLIMMCENRIALSDAGLSNIRRLDTALDRACDMAALALRDCAEEPDQEAVRLAESRFADALCSFFGIDAFSPEGRAVLEKVPVIAVTDPEGMYVGYMADIQGTLKRKWTEKLLFNETGYEDIIRKYCFENDINKNMNRGLSLDIGLPADDMGMFQRNADGIGFMAFYIRYTGNVGNRPEYSFASSISRIADSYYINISGNGRDSYSSPYYYHVRGCRFMSDDCIELNSVRECAQHGAICCPECADVLF